jgi:membrane fusion protein (multidrug efflux system)
VRKVLQLGYVNGEFAEVISGLDAGEKVITQGRVAVREGARVEILNAAADESEAAEPAVAGVATSVR